MKGIFTHKTSAEDDDEVDVQAEALKAELGLLKGKGQQYAMMEVMLGKMMQLEHRWSTSQQLMQEEISELKSNSSNMQATLKDVTDTVLEQIQGIYIKVTM